MICCHAVLTGLENVFWKAEAESFNHLRLRDAPFNVLAVKWQRGLTEVWRRSVGASLPHPRCGEGPHLEAEESLSHSSVC